MSSIVLELQGDVMSPDCNILNLLRKAHLIATKLNLEEFDKWVLCELNGYTNKDSVPEYRYISGSLKEHIAYIGWQDIDDKQIEELYDKIAIRDSLSRLIQINEKSFLVKFDTSINSKIDSLRKTTETKYSLCCKVSQIGLIIESVKNTILDWTLRLEKEGILGEEMQFNSEEKESAKQIPQTVNNYFGHTSIINGEVKNSAIVTGNENTITYTPQNVLKAVSEIESALNNEKISDEDKETAIEMIADIREKISQNKKPSIVRSAFIGLLEFVCGVGASLTAALIQSKIQGLF